MQKRFLCTFATVSCPEEIVSIKTGSSASVIFSLESFSARLSDTSLGNFVDRRYQATYEHKETTYLFSYHLSAGKDQLYSLYIKLCFSEFAASV